MVANKVDDFAQEADAAALWGLGFGEPYPVSALHGRGVGDLLDAVMDTLPEFSADRRPRRSGGPRRVALDRPARTSASPSLLNKLAGSRARRRRQRRRHHPRPGRRAHRARRQDLALRRHGRHPPPRAPDPGRRLLRLAAHPDRAREGRGRRRAHRRRGGRSPSRTCASCSRSIDAGRALVIAYNKWDLARRGAPPLPRARDRAGPRAGAVGAAGRTSRPDRLAHGPAGAGHRDRAGVAGTPASPPDASTPSSARLVAAHPHPVRGGKQPRILFAHPGLDAVRRGSCSSPRASSRPGYRRFIERRLREKFGFEGTPIEVSMRVREKRGKKR